MEARGGFVQQVNRLPGGPSAQFRRQLHALGFAARQGGGGLPQPHIPQPHVVKRFQLAQDLRVVFEEPHRLLDGHVEHFADVLPLPDHFQRLPVIPFPAAHVAGHIQVRQEVHLDLFHAVPLAGFAPAALHVEGEPGLPESAHLRLGAHGIELPDHVEKPRIRGRVAPGRPPDGALVDHDDLVELFDALDFVELSRPGVRPVELPG